GVVLGEVRIHHDVRAVGGDVLAHERVQRVDAVERSEAEGSALLHVYGHRGGGGGGATGRRRAVRARTGDDGEREGGGDEERAPCERASSFPGQAHPSEVASGSTVQSRISEPRRRCRSVWPEK